MEEFGFVNPVLKRGGDGGDGENLGGDALI